MYPMFADAENLILPGIVLLVGLYSAATWVLTRSFVGASGRGTIVAAITIVLICGFELICVVVDLEWPIEESPWGLILFWIIPLLAAIVALIRIRRNGKLTSKQS